MAWDTGGLKLNSENRKIAYIAPKSGALGWVGYLAIPAMRNDLAAYKWINFVMRPDIAARDYRFQKGNFTASQGSVKKIQGKLKEQFAASLS